MPTNDTLQIQVIPNTDPNMMKNHEINPRGYNIYADRSIYLPAGKSIEYYNLNISITPPIDTRIVALKGEGPEHEDWKLHGDRLGIDSTGEAMLALRNKQDAGTPIREGTLVAQLVIVPIQTPTDKHDDPTEMGEDRWCEGCRSSVCTATKCRECLTTLCYGCWKDNRSSPPSMTDEQAEKWIGCRTCAGNWNESRFPKEYEITKGLFAERKKRDDATVDQELQRTKCATAEEAIIKAQNEALKHTNGSMIVTIEDPDDEVHGKRRVIRVNGIRHHQRDRTKKPGNGLQWFDPTFTSRKPWYFSIPIKAFGKSMNIGDSVPGNIPKVIRNQMVKYNKPFKVRSIEKAI